MLKNAFSIIGMSALFIMVDGGMVVKSAASFLNECASTCCVFLLFGLCSNILIHTSNLLTF